MINKLGNTKREAEKLAAKARSSISKYCYTECKSFCCRKGYLILSKKEAVLVMGVQMSKLKKEDIPAINEEGKYLLNIGTKDRSCPRLNKYKCDIHKHAGRPKACKEFPIFIWENKKIRISERCQASREGRFYKYAAKFKSLGYDVN